MKRLIFAISEGDDIVLSCTSDGMPTPSIRWLKDGVKIEPGSAENMEFSVGRGPTHWLIIRAVKQSDAGKYSCIAENSKGTAWCAVTLSVHSDSLLAIPQEPI